MPQMARFRGFEPKFDELAVAAIVAWPSGNRGEAARVDSEFSSILPFDPRR
jgi:hypothetical protein